MANIIIDEKFHIILHELLTINNNLQQIIKKPYTSPTNYYISCKQNPIHGLPPDTDIKNHILIHRHDDIGELFTSKINENLFKLNQKLINLSNNSTIIFTFLIANDSDPTKILDQKTRILYLVENINAFEYSSKHTQIIAHLDITSKYDINVYLAGEIQIIKTNNIYNINYNYDSGTFRISSEQKLQINNFLPSFLYNFFHNVLINPQLKNIIIVNSNSTIQITYSNDNFNKPTLNIKKLNSMCKQLIKIRSKIPYYLLNIPDCKSKINNQLSFDNYSFINPNNGFIKNLEHNNNNQLCQTIIEYYMKPKIGLLNTQIFKYDIDLKILQKDNIFTNSKNVQQNTSFKIINLNLFNRFFDINDYIEIDQTTSLLPDDDFNTRLYNNIMMSVLYNYNIDYISKYSNYCLLNFCDLNTDSLLNIHAGLTNVYPSKNFLKIKDYKKNETSVKVSPILPYNCNKTFLSERDIDEDTVDKILEFPINKIYNNKKNENNVTENEITQQNKETLRIISYNVHNWIRVLNINDYDDSHNPVCDEKKINNEYIYGTSVLDNKNMTYTKSATDEHKQYKNLKPFIQFFQSSNADIVLLQEITPIHNYENPENKNTYLPLFPQHIINTYDKINNNKYNFKLIDQEMKKLGYNYRFISNTLYKRLHDYEKDGFFWLGNAIYSKHCLYNPVSYILPYNRNCIFATIIFNNIKYIIATSHLSYYDEAKNDKDPSYAKQLTKITGLLINYMLSEQCYNVIFGGDFNHEVVSADRRNEKQDFFNTILLKKYGKGYLLNIMDPFNKKFTGFQNKKMIDRFFVSPNITKYHNYETGIISIRSSDHYPIYLDITLDEKYEIKSHTKDLLNDLVFRNKTYKYLINYNVNPKYDILNILPLILYNNITYATENTFYDIHYGLTFNVLEKIIYNKDISNIRNIFFNRTIINSLITVIQPEYNDLVDPIILHALHNNLKINIKNSLNINAGGLTMTELYPNNSIMLFQDNKTTYDEIIPTTLNSCKVRINFNITDQKNPNIFNWEINNLHDDIKKPNLTALDITSISDIDIKNCFDQLIPDIKRSLSEYTQKMCNLVIIKYNNYYIYLHNIGPIKNNLPSNLKEKFNYAQKIYIVPNLSQITINNGTEIIHFLPLP